MDGPEIKEIDPFRFEPNGVVTLEARALPSPDVRAGGDGGVPRNRAVGRVAAIPGQRAGSDRSVDLAGNLPINSPHAPRLAIRQDCRTEIGWLPAEITDPV